MAGLCAALAAARHGATTVLMHDRPVLGGNASSECRVHVCGADRHNGIPNLRETGILEEIRLENLYRNPNRVYSIWDTVLYEKAKLQENLTLLLNCSCREAAVEGERVRSVSGWQLTTETTHAVEAGLFVDCSGDGVLAPLTGAEHRIGREARSEYGESHAPERADSKTMGMTCLFAAREYEEPQPFTPPDWAYTFERCEDLPYGPGRHDWWGTGYWWVELGGEHDSIHDTEALRDELLRIVYGVWDHIKNRGDHGAERWALDWVQFLPAKRESRRFLGDHVLTQTDIEAEGRFEDTAAYGGWAMDDHHPAGFWAVRSSAPATTFHKTPSPYGIPYRCLYSRNVANLLFAGRNASCTHMAMSSTRVMGTCAAMGQAAGTAAALAASLGVDPRGVTDHMGELQQRLLRDDAYLPWVEQEFSALTTEAKLTASSGDPEPVRDGVNRPVGEAMHRWPCGKGDWLAYEFPEPRHVDAATVVLDSALHKNIQMSHHQPDDQLTAPPAELPRRFRIEGRRGETWTPLVEVTANRRRLVRLPVGQRLDAVRFVLEETWGGAPSHLYAFYVD
jgi:hypothetical protein